MVEVFREIFDKDLSFSHSITIIKQTSLIKTNIYALATSRFEGNGVVEENSEGSGWGGGG